MAQELLFLGGRNVAVPGYDRNFQGLAQLLEATPLVVDQGLEGADVQRQADLFAVLQETRQDR